MRQRERLVISRQTGDATMTTEVIDDDATFAQRARELKDTVPDIGPVEARFLAVTCNGCDATASLDFDDPSLPHGWAACDAGDFGDERADKPTVDDRKSPGLARRTPVGCRACPSVPRLRAALSTWGVR